MSVSNEIGHIDTEAASLVSEGLEAPAVYRELSTEYTDLGRLLNFLAGRSFSGLVRIMLEQGSAHVLLFRGRPQAAKKYGTDGTGLVGAEAMERTLADSRAGEGKIWVHELPDELFPESWWEREPIVADLGVPAPGDEPSHEEVVGESASEYADFTPEPVEQEESVSAWTLPDPDTPGTTYELPTGSDGTPPPAGDAGLWAGLIEQMYARFRKFRGPGPAARLQAQVNAALAGSGARLENGRVTGHVPGSDAALRGAAVGCAGYIRHVAGLAFLERSLEGAFSHLRVDDRGTYRDTLGL